MSLKMRMALLGYPAVLLAVALPIDLSGANGNFVPDWTFKGSALTEWQPLGQADWRAENGEIVGTPATGRGRLARAESVVPGRAGGGVGPLRRRVQARPAGSRREDARRDEGHSRQLRARRHGRLRGHDRRAGQGTRAARGFGRAAGRRASSPMPTARSRMPRRDAAARRPRRAGRAARPAGGRAGTAAAGAAGRGGAATRRRGRWCTRAGGGGGRGRAAHARGLHESRTRRRRSSSKPTDWNDARSAGRREHPARLAERRTGARRGQRRGRRGERTATVRSRCTSAARAKCASRTSASRTSAGA